eukprot:TRINITY_DN7888_c0_g2_i1.p1 TRINITY_DN7888_c0_g2~~TRINITY_DN7888_c0_g2_i1.p1  ORF type:complete len:428 (+),score=35.52 TRINITY_DN7888_c0_g2_i1:48-1286(+)
MNAHDRCAPQSGGRTRKRDREASEDETAAAQRPRRHTAVCDNTSHKVRGKEDFTKEAEDEAETIDWGTHIAGNSDGRPGNATAFELCVPTDIFVRDVLHEPGRTEVFVCDSRNNRVVRYLIATAEAQLRDGEVVCGCSNLQSPSGIWVDGPRLFVTDTGNSRVVMVEMVRARALHPHGGWYLLGPAAHLDRQKLVVVAGGRGPGNAADQLRWPRRAVLRSAGLVVADTGNNRVMLWRMGTEAGIVLVSNCLSPYGLMFLGNAIILTEAPTDRPARVTLWRGDGDKPIVLAEGPSIAAPDGLCRDPATGTIFVAVRGGCCVKRIAKVGSLMRKRGEPRTRAVGFLQVGARRDLPRALMVHGPYLYVVCDHRVFRVPVFTHQVVAWLLCWQRSERPGATQLAEIVVQYFAQIKW